MATNKPDAENGAHVARTDGNQIKVSSDGVKVAGGDGVKADSAVHVDGDVKFNGAVVQVRKYLKFVGKPFRKVDARSKCVGETRFADDISLPRMLYCKILRSHVPHALIKRVDPPKA